MEKLNSLIADLKSWLAGTDEKIAKLTLAEERVKALEAELAQAKSEASLAVGNFNLLAEERKADTAKHASELSALQAKLTEAENKATEALANQGIRSADLPPASTDNAGVKSADQQIKSLRDKLKATNDPREKYNLSAQIKELLSKKN